MPQSKHSPKWMILITQFFEDDEELLEAQTC